MTEEMCPFLKHIELTKDSKINFQLCTPTYYISKITVSYVI